MAKTKWWIACLFAAALGAAQAQAQIGGGAAPAAPTGGGTAAAAPAAAAAAGGAQPGFFKKMCIALEECKRKLCKTPAGQMLNSMTLPLSAATGGIIPPFCPLMPSAADLLKEGVDGAAANAKKDALEAKERVKAVRYLGTLDCRYYPEAEAAPIAALRTDRIECVRWEAAIALGRGCCCTKRIMEALEITVSGSIRDGNPDERSERVREAAFFALNNCVACYREPPVEIDGGDIREKEKGKDGDLKPKVTKIDRELVERSRHTLAMYGTRREAPVAGPMSTPRSVLPNGQRSLFHIVRYSADGDNRPVQQPIQQVVRVTQPMPQVVAAAPRQLPPVNSAYAQQPMPRERAPLAVVPDEKPIEMPITKPIEMPISKPIEKPATAVVAVEPMDPTPVVAPPENRVETPAVPLAASITPTPPVQPTMSEKPVSAEKAVASLVESMLTGSTPLERHQSIRAIVAHDWKKYPQIIAALVKTARLDSDRAVRVSAIRHMAALKIDVAYVCEHLKFMQNDSDEWVKQESTMALERMAAK